MAAGIISLNINVLPNRYFLNHFILSLIELPSTASSGICVQYLGRRFTSIVSYLLRVLISLMAVVLEESELTELTHQEKKTLYFLSNTKQTPLRLTSKQILKDSHYW